MIEFTRKELIERFGKILKNETIFGSLWSIADESYINKTLDELIEKLADSALSSGHRVTIPPGSDIGWLVAGANPDQQAVQQTLDKEAKIREVTQAYEKYMGFNPLEWGKLERLQKFLLTKSVEEIKTFAAWSRKEYSTLTPPKARQYPQLVIDCWNLAFEKPTAENNTKSAIQEAIHGRTN